MSQIGLRMIGLFRILSVLFLVAVLAFIGLNLLTHSKKRVDVFPEVKEIGQQKIEKQERIEHIETERQKEYVQIQADRHYPGENNLYHLEGNVEVIFPKRRKGKDVVVNGQEVLYDKEYKHFYLKGKGRIRYEDLTVESPSLEYDSEEEVFKTDQGIAFSFSRASGAAGKMVYWMKEERIELEENISIELLPKMEKALPLRIQADRLDYSRQARKGMAQEKVKVFYGESQSSADTLEFELFLDADEIRHLILKDKARAELAGEEKSREKRLITADEIKIRAFLNIPQVHAVEAKGNASFESYSPGGGLTQVTAEAVEFVLSREGDLREFRAEGGARMVIKEGKSKDQKIIEGEAFLLDGGRRLLKVKGSEERRGRVVFEDREISADSLNLFLDDDRLEAEVKVKVVFKSPEGDKKTIGFFSQQEPVFVTAGKVGYDPGAKRFLFEEGVKVWQEKMTLRAKELSLSRDTGRIACSGGVRTVIPYRPKEGGEERVEIVSDRMSFDPDKKLISYQENCSLNVQVIRLSAQNLSVELAGEKEEMKTIRAQGKVTIFQGPNEGRGEQAFYAILEEKVILSGKPVFIDKDKGQTEGDKLTFYLADGRIVIENRGGERSVTFIK